MLSTTELFLDLCLAFFIFPLAVYSLMTGSVPPHGLAAKYYRAEPWLMPVGNVFLLSLCAGAIARLLTHYGYLSESMRQTLEPLFMIPFGVLLVIYLGCWIRALLRVRRQVHVDSS